MLNSHDGNPILTFALEKSTIHYIGSDLQRPECILAEPNDMLWSRAYQVFPWIAQQIAHDCVATIDLQAEKARHSASHAY